METQRQKHSNMPPIEGWSLLPETDTYSRFCIVRFHRGQWSVKKLGVVGNSEVEAVRIAPQRYYYVAAGYRTYLGRTDRPILQILTKDMLLGVFSPDSHYLFGYSRADGSLKIFDCQRRKARLSVEAEFSLDTESEYDYLLGWYPDSRHVWYTPNWITEEGRSTMGHYYRLDIQTGQRRRLNAEQVKKLFRDWDLLNPLYRFWHPSLQGNQAFAYSQDAKLRVKVAPHYIYSLDHPNDYSNVYLESRGRDSRLLLKAGDHAWAKIYPQDVSLDGRWVLLLAAYWRDEVRGERRLEHELVVIETRTKEIFYPFRGRQEKYAQIGSPDPLERSYWFGKA